MQIKIVQHYWSSCCSRFPLFLDYVRTEFQHSLINQVITGEVNYQSDWINFFRTYLNTFNIKMEVYMVEWLEIQLDTRIETMLD